jgi:hypothetical protein
MRVQNLHGLAMSGFPLVSPARPAAIARYSRRPRSAPRDGNVTELRLLKLRCTECDGTQFEGTIFSAQDQVDAFLAVLSKGGGRLGF